jgi:transposase
MKKVVLMTAHNYQSNFINVLSIDIEKLSREERYKERCDYLCAFRGINTISAMTILTHIPDFRTFPHPSKLMSYIGLTSMENSSGESVNRSGITKQGNSLLRKIIILAAQYYNRADHAGIHMIQKRVGLPSSIVSLAQRADRRCRNKYYHLTSRGRHSNIAKTAIARELVSFIWEVMIIYYQGELCTPA